MAIYGGFLSSKGSNGWYMTQEDDEIIKFDYPLESIFINALQPLTIQLNGTKDNIKEENLLYLGEEEGARITGMKIYSLRVVGASGQPIKWQGLLV